MESFGVFDIIGPRMIGPSSSHTAGAAKLAFVARKIANNDVASAHLTLYGSFAETGRGHGTDIALTAGILGLHPDDDALRHAFRLARERGIDVEIEFSDDEVERPNTAAITITGRSGAVTRVVGASIGGGNILITEIDGLAVELNGEYPTLIIKHHDVPGVIMDTTRILAGNGINVAFMQVFRHSRGQEAYMVIETDQMVDAAVAEAICEQCPQITQVRVV